MITLTRTELQWIEMWLRELESIHKQGDDASHPLVKLNLSTSKEVDFLYPNLKGEFE